MAFYHRPAGPRRGDRDNGPADVSVRSCQVRWPVCRRIRLLRLASARREDLLRAARPFPVSVITPAVIFSDASITSSRISDFSRGVGLTVVVVVDARGGPRAGTSASSMRLQISTVARGRLLLAVRASYSCSLGRMQTKSSCLVHCSCCHRPVSSSR